MGLSHQDHLSDHFYLGHPSVPRDQVVQVDRILPWSQVDLADQAALVDPVLHFVRQVQVYREDQLDQVDPNKPIQAKLNILNSISV